MRYLIASANGYGNTGDDLIALAIAQQIKSIDKSAIVSFTRPPFNNTLADLAHVIIVGGGGILYDHDKSATNADNYMQYIDYAKSQGKPALVVGVGEQGINTQAGKQRFKQSLDLADLITVRSGQDKDVLEKIGVKRKIHDLSDPVFSLKPSISLGLRLKRLYSFLNKRPVLAFNLADLGNQGFKKEAFGRSAAEPLIEFSEYIKTSPSLKNVFDHFHVKLVCQSRDDMAYYEQIKGRFNEAELVYHHGETAMRLFDEFYQSDFVLTGRYHGLIAAAMMDKPIISVGIPGQKIDKLVSGRIMSLRSSFISIRDFVKTDAFANMHEISMRARKPSVSELAEAKKMSDANAGYILNTVLSVNRHY